ncbi:MAG: hypothetical protein ACJ765_09415 [Chloroflexota bacterium]
MPMDPAAVARKLKLSAARSPAVLGASPDDLAALSQARPDLATSTSGTHDWILLYVENRAALEAALAGASAALASPGTLWIAYPKGASKRQTDLTRDKGWDSLSEADLMWLSLISIDETWSAFGLRHYKPGEARQTFR